MHIPVFWDQINYSKNVWDCFEAATPIALVGSLERVKYMYMQMYIKYIYHFHP